MRVNRGAAQIREKREKCFVHERGSRQLGWSVASQNALVHTNAKKIIKKKFKFTVYLSVRITFNRCEYKSEVITAWS